ncbi:MAG: hypothetical protein HOY78_00820 [Saccharothrix sp.]|nr:hypothetical protein [Saccharothrix sp.]
MLVPLLLAATLTAPATTDAVRTTYLPVLPGHTATEAVAVNEWGHVAGTSTGPDGRHAVLWRHGGVVDTGLGDAAALNRRDQVLRLQTVDTGPYARHPRIWTEGVSTDIAPAGAGYVAASAINASGVVPMTYSTSPYGYHQEAAAVWRNGALSGLGEGGAHLSVGVVTDGGLIAGSKQPMFSGDIYAFRCTGTSCTRLAGVAGSGGYRVSAANESGVIVGTRGDLPLRWSGDTVTVLPGGPGAVSTSGQAVNERGDVVGRTGDRATLWRDGRAVVLDVPAPSAAVAVSDSGDVVGWSGTRAFLWRAGRVVWLGAGTPVGLNDSGVVVGRDGTRAVLWQV